MTVNNLRLPDTLVQLLNEGQTEWMSKGNVDAYGNEFTVSRPHLFRSLETIEAETAKLSQRFGPRYEEHVRAAGEWSWWPGFIPYIEEFSKIVALASVDTGDIFVLDYRENPQNPSVLFWHDIVWRRVAPTFDAFIDLYEPFDVGKWAERDD
jgi:hypothetical protein